MTPFKRAAVAFATGILLTVGSAALAAPAHADVHLDVANLVGADSNGTVDISGPGGGVLLSVPNVAPDIL
ncbi:hypothetical protein SNS2_2176 [Streptomyces netropsis]|uniref:Small secreted domain n=1 Tax=Streptomyces syringium TaxID=76729 RepID=A0ABS4Y5S0_9ACTN|nr:hypothetical protein [Streptomyces syringium]MBP2404089.1 hypothetical protein [Streptomyces syringium]SPE53722.1 hypothetical protein SNS2_2176 [Streptomyces netropsis]